MSRRQVVAAAVIVIGLLIGGLAWYVLGGDAPAKPTLGPATSATAAGPATADGSWRIAPGDGV